VTDSILVAPLSLICRVQIRLAYPDIISDMINYPDIRITHYPDMISA
jgi:hypothetical protein